MLSFAYLQTNTLNVLETVYLFVYVFVFICNWSDRAYSTW